MYLVKSHRQSGPPIRPKGVGLVDEYSLKPYRSVNQMYTCVCIAGGTNMYKADSIV
jgi:hypothetical protein